jgi:hypothetical protein
MADAITRKSCVFWMTSMTWELHQSQPAQNWPARRVKAAGAFNCVAQNPTTETPPQPFVIWRNSNIAAIARKDDRWTSRQLYLEAKGERARRKVLQMAVSKLHG